MGAPVSSERVGVLINSALYLTLVFAAGMLTADATAWKLATATAGLCFLTYAVAEIHKGAALVLMGLTWVTGVVAGVALLV
jgi:hypothetical protein